MTLIFVFIHLQICPTPIEQFTQPDHFTPGKIPALKITVGFYNSSATHGYCIYLSAINDANLRINLFAKAGCCSINWSSMACCFTSSLLSDSNIFQHAASTCHAGSVLFKKITSLMAKEFFAGSIPWLIFIFLHLLDLFPLDLEHYFLLSAIPRPTSLPVSNNSPSKVSTLSWTNRETSRFHPFSSMFFCIHLRSIGIIPFRLLKLNVWFISWKFL